MLEGETSIHCDGIDHPLRLECDLASFHCFRISLRFQVAAVLWYTCMPFIIHISFAQPAVLLETLVLSHAVQAEGCEVVLYLDYFLKPGMMEERDRAISTWWTGKRRFEPLGPKLQCDSNLPMPAYAFALLKPMHISQSIFSCEIVKFESPQGGR